MPFFGNFLGVFLLNPGHFFEAFFTFYYAALTALLSGFREL